MATETTMPSPEGGPLTIDHVTRSLSQIESWIGAVRMALSGLTPGMPLPVTEGLTPIYLAPIKVQKECPNPTPHKKKPAKKNKKK
jgi:hypothetical protein